MKYLALVAGVFALQATAFPFALDNALASGVEMALEKRQGVTAPSKARKNCGVRPCLTFNAAEQFVSTTGQYAYASPRPNQIRGPCPGLNAAANHGYLPRSGVASIVQTIDGLGKAYGMSADLAGFLAAYAVVFDGDILTQSWSIGGPPRSSIPSILGKPQGISYSHNNYEGDASIARADAFLNNGDAHSLILERFRDAYASTDRNINGGQADRYTLDAFAQNYGKKLNQSIATNRYFFAAPFSGLVAPAAYNFVINFMSNHTAQNPNGYLDGAQFKTFFAVSGNRPSNFVWNRGQERIPNNWYRRTSTNQYNAADVFLDLGAQFAAYPYQVKFGGNTGRTNTFTGLDLGNLTGGAFNGATLLQGNNLQCFFAQVAQAGIPDVATGLFSALNDIVNKYFNGFTNGLGCPQITKTKYDQSLFGKYPGSRYNPTGPAQNFKE